jgi:hypothetical protein
MADRANSQYRRVLRVIAHSSFAFYALGYLIATLSFYFSDPAKKTVIFLTTLVVSIAVTLIFLIFGDNWLFKMVAEGFARSLQILHPTERRVIGKYHFQLTYWVARDDCDRRNSESKWATVSNTEDDAFQEMLRRGQVVERVRAGFVTIKSTVLGLKIECHDQYDDRSPEKAVVVKYWCSDFVSVSEEGSGLVLFFVYNIFREGYGMSFEKDDSSVNKLGRVEARNFDDRMIFRGTFADYAVIHENETQRYGRIELSKVL